MKSPERQLTEWAAGAITYDYGDDPNVVVRVYTAEGWTRYCTHLLTLACGIVRVNEMPQEPQPDPNNGLERCISALRQLIGNVGAFTRRDGVEGNDIHDKWAEFVKTLFDPKRMLRYESAAQVLMDLQARLSEALSNALSIRSIAPPQA